MKTSADVHKIAGGLAQQIMEKITDDFAMRGQLKGKIRKRAMHQQ